MKAKTIFLATLAATSVVLPCMQPSLAQATGQQVTIHEDLLKCYQNLGRTADQEKEFQWLISARPGNALWHYNYGCLLRTQSKNGLALAQFERAAQLEGANVDYEGQAGQMAYNMKQFQKAYNYLGKAMQIPGGEKYKSAFEGLQQYLMQLKQQQLNAPSKAGAKGGGGKTAAPKRSDDDDD